MSSSDLYRVYRTKATHCGEFCNSWGTAALLWDFLWKRFVSSEGNWIFGGERLWPLATDTRVPRSLRIVHAFTFDAAICPPDRAGELADACDEVAKTCNRPGVNHWPAVAVALRSARARPRQLGWALASTSVNDQWISWKGEPKPWDIFGLVD